MVGVHRQAAAHDPVCGAPLVTPPGGAAMSHVQLILVVTATYTGAVGYGDVFECRIVEQRSGPEMEGKLALTVVAGDEARGTFLLSHRPPHKVEITFVRRRENEPYATAPITGFVDASRRSWEVVDMREADP